MESGVEKVDSGAGGSQHRRVGRPRQLRACVGLVLVAVLAAAPLPLAAQQEQRVVRGLSFDGNKAIDSYTLSTAIATSNSAFFASVWWLRWIGFLGEKRSFNELEFRRDVVRLLLLYRQSGYMDAVIDTLVRRDGNDVFIRFRIMEGDPVRLERLEITGLDGILSLDALKKDLPLAVGAPFNRMLFQASGDTIVARLRNRGYPYVDVLRSFDVNAAERRAVASAWGWATARWTAFASRAGGPPSISSAGPGRSTSRGASRSSAWGYRPTGASATTCAARSGTI